MMYYQMNVVNNSTETLRIYIIFNKMLLQACHIQFEKVTKLFFSQVLFSSLVQAVKNKDVKCEFLLENKVKCEFVDTTCGRSRNTPQRPAQLASMPQVCLTLDFISKLPNRPLNVLCVSRKITLPIHLNLLGENYYVLFFLTHIIYLQLIYWRKKF